MKFSLVRRVKHGKKSEIEFSMVFSSDLRSLRECTGLVAMAQERRGQFNLLPRF